MDFLDIGWIWLYVGAGLMLAELLTPGFVTFFFGLSAATVGGLVLLLPDPFNPSFKWQLAFFSLFSLIYLVTLRRYVKNVFFGDNGRSRTLPDEFAGRIGEVVAAIAPDIPGRIAVGDAEWTATAEEHIPAGEKVKVVSRSNLTLRVKRI